MGCICSFPFVDFNLAFKAPIPSTPHLKLNHPAAQFSWHFMVKLTVCGTLAVDVSGLTLDSQHKKAVTSYDKLWMHMVNLVRCRTATDHAFGELACTREPSSVRARGKAWKGAPVLSMLGLLMSYSWALGHTCKMDDADGSVQKNQAVWICSCKKAFLTFLSQGSCL